MSAHLETKAASHYEWTERAESLLRRFVQSGFAYSEIVGKMPADSNGIFPTRAALLGKMHRGGVKAPQYWNEATEALLRELAPKLSATEITKRLPCLANGSVISRRVVVDKARLMGLRCTAYARETIAAPRLKKPVETKKQGPKMVWGRPRGDSRHLALQPCAPLPSETQVASDPLRISIMDLQHDSCRWPLGDPRNEDFAYCGLKAVEGRPYCGDHCGLAYTTAAEQRRMRAKWLAERGLRDGAGAGA